MVLRLARYTQALKMVRVADLYNKSKAELQTAEDRYSLTSLQAQAAEGLIKEVGQKLELIKGNKGEDNRTDLEQELLQFLNNKGTAGSKELKRLKEERAVLEGEIETLKNDTFTKSQDLQLGIARAYSIEVEKIR